MKQSREFTMLRCVHGKAENNSFKFFCVQRSPFSLRSRSGLTMIRGTRLHHAEPTPTVRTNHHHGRIVRIREGLCPDAGFLHRELVLVARNKEALQQLAAELEEKHPGLARRRPSLRPGGRIRPDNLAGRLSELPAAKTLRSSTTPERETTGNFGRLLGQNTHLLRLNVESFTRLCHAMIPGLKRNGGDIINISSLAALLPIPDFAVYAATKAYVSSLSEALRLELKEHGIRVLAVCPGPVSTGFGKAARRPGFTGNMMPGRNAFDTPTETVVNDSLRALSCGRARVFPGMKIRLAALLLNAALGLIRFFMGADAPGKSSLLHPKPSLPRHETPPPRNHPHHLVQAYGLRLPGSHGGFPLHAVSGPDHPRPERRAGTGDRCPRRLPAPHFPAPGTAGPDADGRPGYCRTPRHGHGRCAPAVSLDAGAHHRPAPRAVSAVSARSAHQAVHRSAHEHLRAGPRPELENPGQLCPARWPPATRKPKAITR